MWETAGDLMTGVKSLHGRHEQQVPTVSICRPALWRTGSPAEQEFCDHTQYLIKATSVEPRGPTTASLERTVTLMRLV